jgi:DNA integrity scanning protein DisA with diadenylate cyclase activity
MRHRAGIGLTEQTDAVVIIVSEERGRISVADAGKIQEDVTPNELRQLLLTLRI